MNENDLSKHILRLTEILLNLLHEEKRLYNCCHFSLETVQKQINALFQEAKEILELYDSFNFSFSCETELFRKNFQESLIDKLSFSFTVTLIGCCNLLTIYDGLNKQNSSSLPESSSSSLLSIKQEATIRLSFGIVFKLAFGSLLKANFSDGDKLLPISKCLNLSSRIDNDLENNLEFDFSTNYTLCCIIYKTFLQYSLTSPSVSNIRIHSYFLKDCFSILIACRIFFMTRPEMRQSLESIHEELNKFSENNSNQQMILRDLLLLRHFKPTVKIGSLLNFYLLKTFKQSNGIETLIEAVLDSDPLSENTTTIATRIASIASILVYLPCKNIEEYHKNIANQALKILQIDETIKMKNSLKHSSSIFLRVASQVLFQMHTSNGSLIDSVIFEPLKQVLAGSKIEQIPSINSAIEVIHRIIVYTVGFPIELFYDFCRPLIFVRFTLERSKTSPLKTILDQILAYLFQNLPESVYLLDEIINISMEVWLNKYKIAIDSQDLSFRLIVQEIDSIQDKEDFELIPMFASSLTKFLQKLPKDFSFDLFFLLLEKLILDKKNLISLLLMSNLAETLLDSDYGVDEDEDKQLLSTMRRVRFLSNTFERVVMKVFDEKNFKSNEKIMIFKDNNDDDKDEFGLYRETMKICIGILDAILLKVEEINWPRKKDKMLKKDEQIYEKFVEKIEYIKCELDKCREVLKIILSNSKHTKVLTIEETIQIDSIYHRLFKISRDVNEDEKKTVNMSNLNKALSLLREPLMPVRAHGLIVIRQLIQAKDPCVQEKFQLILDCVQELLIDSDSYLYLAAINALGALAINHTDNVLPVLLDELIGLNTDRKGKVISLDDRLKIGEALMQLAKSIGDFAYHYSTIFINKLLLGVKSQDPTIRISSLVCLGKFCRNFKYGLSTHIVELVFMGEKLLISDDCLDVRRASADFFRQLLEGLDKENVWFVQDYIKTIKDALMKASATTLDDILQLHCSLGYDELTRISNELLNVSRIEQMGFREIK